jgi:hypothetical protein
VAAAQEFPALELRVCLTLVAAAAADQLVEPVLLAL